MAYKIALFITLICLAGFFAIQATWLHADVQGFCAVGAIAALVAAIALVVEDLHPKVVR